MIMPIDIDKKEFSRDKRGYNSREVDEFLDIIVADYEKVLNDNRSMAHKIKSLEKQLAEAQKDDNAMLETLETAKKLMADISASAERRAELMMRDAELEAENMLLDARVSVRKLTDEHSVLTGKVNRLRNNFRRMLETELAKLDEDEFDILQDLADPEPAPAAQAAPKADIPVPSVQSAPKASTLVVADKSELEAPQSEADAKIAAKSTMAVPGAAPAVKDLEHATISDLSESLKKMAEEPATISDTIILK
ncbi:MAG: DivIVA domain-containing protein [Mogibacterium sp.]|nr:DivIVA domain-containing protein [Mogibacterium sp.]